MTYEGILLVKFPEKSFSTATPGYNSMRLGGAFYSYCNLMQLRVLRLGFLQDGDVGVGVFPEGEEVLVCALRFDGVVREGVGTGQSQMRQCADEIVLHHAGVVENLLELGGGSAALVRRQISLATQINGVERDIPKDRPEFIGRSRDECFEGLVGSAALESSGRVDHGQVIELYDRVLWEAPGQVGGQPRGLRGVTCQTQRNRGHRFDICAG